MLGRRICLQNRRYEMELPVCPRGSTHLYENGPGSGESHIRDNGTAMLTDDAPATSLRDHLQTCVLVTKEGASKVDTNDALEIFRSSL